MSQKLERILETYAFNAQQKNQLRIADSKNLELSYLANPLLDWEQMREIIICMEYNIDPTPLCNPNIPSEDIEKLREHLFKLHGVYEQVQEDITKKRTKRIIATVFIAIFLVGVFAFVYANRDNIAYYLEDLELELTTDRIELNTGDTFVASDYIKKYDHDLELKIPTLKTDIPGEFQVTYTISNKLKKESKHIIVIVKDNIAPVIELKQHTLEITEGVDFKSADYIISAVDNVDKDLKNKVIVTSKVDTSKPGKYTVTYSVGDQAGNAAEEKLVVTVVPKVINSPASPETSTGSNNNIEAPVKPPAITTITVTAMSKEFYNANPLVAKNEAVAYGKSMLTARKANGYDCNPIYDQTTNLAIGYRVTFY